MATERTFILRARRVKVGFGVVCVCEGVVCVCEGVVCMCEGVCEGVVCA